MALSYSQYVGNGSNKTFNLTFPYISKAHVQVKVDGVAVAFSWLTPSSIQTAVAPVNGLIVELRRVTPRDQLLVDFKDASTLVETDLDLSALQTFYLAQEAFDQGEASLGVTSDGSFSALNRRISNVLSPTQPNDVATKQWAENGVSSGVQVATTKAAEAATSATNAKTSETNAASSASAASSSKDAATTKASEAAASATNAATSETNAANSATAAASSKTAAKTSETNAKTSETNAAASASAAATFDPAGYYTKAQMDALLSSAVPVGSTIYVDDTVAPSGYLKRNGATVSRTTYAALFAKIGTRYGAGDGSTTFALPDSRGEFIRCLDDGRGVDTGRVIGSKQTDQNKAHSHTLNDPGHSHSYQKFETTSASFQNANGTIGRNGAATTGAATTGITINSDGGAEARPRNEALLACIKY